MTYEERLEADLNAIRQRVGEVGEMVDVAVSDATRSMLEDDKKLASMTILRDLPVNRATRQLDRQCHQFVARHYPSAGVLRTISAVLRISTALERIGDYAVSIAKGAIKYHSRPPSQLTEDVRMMSTQSRSMLSQSLEAFRKENAELARGTMAMEHQSDVFYRRVFRDLLEASDRPDVDIRDLFAMLNTFNRLERIADQAKNICEQTLFAVTGEVKPPKSVKVLFVDDRNAEASILATAIAQKAYGEIGRFESAGWDVAETVEADFVDFMDRHGLDTRGLAPRSLDTSFDFIRDHLAIIALAPGLEQQIPELPWSVVVLDWSEEVQAAAESDDPRETLYKLLATKIPDLMDILSGERT